MRRLRVTCAKSANTCVLLSSLFAYLTKKLWFKSLIIRAKTKLVVIINIAIVVVAPVDVDEQASHYQSRGCYYRHDTRRNA